MGALSDTAALGDHGTSVPAALVTRVSMAPTSWRVREGGGATALMSWCYAAGKCIVAAEETP